MLVPYPVQWLRNITKIDDKKSVSQDLFNTLIYTFSSEYIKVGYPVFFFSSIIRVLYLWVKMEMFHDDLLLFLFCSLAHKSRARLLYLFFAVHTVLYVTLLPVLFLHPKSVHVQCPAEISPFHITIISDLSLQ